MRESIPTVLRRDEGEEGFGGGAPGRSLSESEGYKYSSQPERKGSKRSRHPRGENRPREGRVDTISGIRQNGWGKLY